MKNIIFYYIWIYPTFIRIIEGRITDNFFWHYPDIIRIILFGWHHYAPALLLEQTDFFLYPALMLGCMACLAEYCRELKNARCDATLKQRAYFGQTAYTVVTSTASSFSTIFLCFCLLVPARRPRARSNSTKFDYMVSKVCVVSVKGGEWITRAVFAT